MVRKPTQREKARSKKSVRSRTKALGERALAVPQGDRAVTSNQLEGDGSYSVSGTVTYTDKTPAAGVTVIAFDQDIGGEDRLRDAVTDEKGLYRIEYTDAQFRRSKNESRGADIF